MFRKISGIEKFQAKEGGSFTVLSETFLSHRTEKTSPGNHSVFQKISGREKYFMDKRGGITIFRLSVPKYFIGEHFGVSEKFFYRKFSCIGGGGPSRFCQNFFVSQDRNEKLCKRTLLFSGNFLVSKKIYGWEGAYHVFESKFLCLTVPKNFVCIPSMFQKLGYRKILCIIGGITNFRRIFFASQCRKTSYSDPLVFH